jgi:S-adenosylmethionine synthetase
VQIAYAIGLVRPLSISIKTEKGNIKPLCLWYKESEPKRIIEDLKLKEISYEEQAKWGHFR